MSFVGLHS